MTNTEILQNIQANQDHPPKSLNAWLLLGASLIAFAGVGIVQWDMEFLILLVVALFIHELGHLLAMKLFRYKNLKMLFLPFFGAAASGQSREQSATKIAWISLFGPLTGLLSCYVALILWYFFPSKYLMSYAELALFLNVFNLLPIVPLDGGHFLNETILARHPRAELTFRIFAVLGLAFLAYFLESWIFGLIALFTLITLGVHFKLAQATAKLRSTEGFKGEDLTEEKVERIREEIRQANPHYESAKNIKHLPKVIEATWLNINKTFPSIPMTIGLLAAYAAVFIILPAVTVVAIWFVANPWME